MEASTIWIVQDFVSITPDLTSYSFGPGSIKLHFWFKTFLILLNGRSNYVFTYVFLQQIPIS